jgi:hypothetical protein
MPLSLHRSAGPRPSVCIGLALTLVIVFFSAVPTVATRMPATLGAGPAARTAIALFTFDFPGSTNTQATAITPRGDIVGRYFMADGSQHGFLLRAGVFTSIDVPGANSTDVTWINARRDIVGSYGDTRGEHAYVLSGGEFTTIDFPSSNQVSTLGFGISNSGEVVGVEFGADFLKGHGYLFSHGIFSLIDVPGAAGTFPTMVLDSGEIVGAYIDTTGVFHGFRQSGGVFTTIDFPDSTFTWITGINPEGDIVGFYNSKDGNQHGLILAEGMFISIDIPSGTSSEANGVDPRGDVVGRYVTPDGNTHGYYLRCAACTRHD